MVVVRNEQHGNYAYSQLFQGPAGGLQDRDAYNVEARKQWRWLDSVLGPTLAAAVKEVGLKVPLVVRLEGTNVEAGKKIINTSGLDVIAADDLKDGAQKIVKAVKG